MGSLHKPSRHHRNRRAFSGELEPLMHGLYGFEIASQDTSALQHRTLLIEAELHQPLLGLAVFLGAELLSLGHQGDGAVGIAPSPWRRK